MDGCNSERIESFLYNEEVGSWEGGCNSERIESAFIFTSGLYSGLIIDATQKELKESGKLLVPLPAVYPDATQKELKVIKYETKII